MKENERKTDTKTTCCLTNSNILYFSIQAAAKRCNLVVFKSSPANDDDERTSHETVRAIAFHVCSAVSSDATNETTLIRRVYKRLHAYFRDAAAPAKGYGRGGEIDEHKLMFGASNKTGLAASITAWRSVRQGTITSRLRSAANIILGQLSEQRFTSSVQHFL